MNAVCKIACVVLVNQAQVFALPRPTVEFQVTGWGFPLFYSDKTCISVTCNNYCDKTLYKYLRVIDMDHGSLAFLLLRKKKLLLLKKKLMLKKNKEQQDQILFRKLSFTYIFHHLYLSAFLGIYPKRLLSSQVFIFIYNFYFH